MQNFIETIKTRSFVHYKIYNNKIVKDYTNFEKDSKLYHIMWSIIIYYYYRSR